MTDNRPTELDELLGTRSGSLDLAGAKLVSSVGSLMKRAMTVTGKRPSQVADGMCVSPGRISQILAAGGNIKLSTLARFMDACGYEVHVTASPKDPTIPSLERRRRGPRRDDSVPTQQWSWAGETHWLAAGASSREFDKLRPSHAFQVLLLGMGTYASDKYSCLFEEPLTGTAHGLYHNDPEKASR